MTETAGARVDLSYASSGEPLTPRDRFVVRVVACALLLQAVHVLVFLAGLSFEALTDRGVLMPRDLDEVIYVATGVVSLSLMISVLLKTTAGNWWRRWCISCTLLALAMIWLPAHQAWNDWFNQINIQFVAPLDRVPNVLGSISRAALAMPFLGPILLLGSRTARRFRRGALVLVFFAFSVSALGGCCNLLVAASATRQESGGSFWGSVFGALATPLDLVSLCRLMHFVVCVLAVVAWPSRDRVATRAAIGLGIALVLIEVVSLESFMLSAERPRLPRFFVVLDMAIVLKQLCVALPVAFLAYSTWREQGVLRYGTRSAAEVERS